MGDAWVYRLLLYTISISILCVSPERLSLIESSEDINDLRKINLISGSD